MYRDQLSAVIRAAVDTVAARALWQKLQAAKKGVCQRTATCRGITKAGVQTEMIDALSADPQVGQPHKLCSHIGGVWTQSGPIYFSHANAYIIHLSKSLQSLQKEKQ